MRLSLDMERRPCLAALQPPSRAAHPDAPALQARGHEAEFLLPSAYVRSSDSSSSGPKQRALFGGTAMPMAKLVLLLCLVLAAALAAHYITPATMFAMMDDLRDH